MAVEMILGEMIEKSLKQWEQLEGYLRDKYSKDKEETVKDFQKIFSNDGKGSFVVDRSKKIEKTRWIVILWEKMASVGLLES